MFYSALIRFRVIFVILAALGVLALGISPAAAKDERPVLQSETLGKIAVRAANQGVGVDDRYIYAVDNYRITKLDKATGEPVLQWDGVKKGGVIMHLDSGFVLDGKLYCAHSNWPNWPMTSSVEVFDTATMKHIDTYSFGIQVGSFTWLDRYDGYWWGTFANYNRVQKGAQMPYGMGHNTQMVKMNDDFQILEAWTYPEALLKKFEHMSNSGGSWGPDGRLYITGHDLPDVYVMDLPDAGSILKWVATVEAPDIAGQGIAWDRSSRDPILYGIYRPKHEVIKMSMPVQDGEPRRKDIGVVHGPGEMVE